MALIAILADAAVTAAQADTARRYDGWVAVDAGHPLRLFYGGGLGRVVPLAQLGPADLIGLQNAVLVEGDGHVEPLRPAPLPAAGPPPPPVAPHPRQRRVALGGTGRHLNAFGGRSSSASSRGHAATGARRPTRARLTGVRSGDTLT